MFVTMFARHTGAKPSRYFVQRSGVEP